jgi:hypothetical protein
MSLPRQVLPGSVLPGHSSLRGATVLAAARRRNEQRVHVLSDRGRAAVSYRLVLPCALSNHYHAVIFDRWGRSPEFLEHFHKGSLGRSMGARRASNLPAGRWRSPTARSGLRLWALDSTTKSGSGSRGCGPCGARPTPALRTDGERAGLAPQVHSPLRRPHQKPPTDLPGEPPRGSSTLRSKMMSRCPPTRNPIAGPHDGVATRAMRNAR